MNKTRRKSLDKAFALLEEAKSIIDTAHAEEIDQFDGLSERQQEGEKGEAIQGAINALEEAQGSVETAMEAIQQAQGEE